MTDPAPNPPVDRPITPRARRRSWSELHVRPWVLLTALFLIAALIMGATRLRKVTRERWVVESGVPVTARVQQVGISPQHQADRDEVLYAILEYTPPGATAAIRSAGYLPRKPGEIIKARENLDIKIDPDDPSFFSDRTDLPPYTAELGVPLLLLGISLPCLLFTWLARRGALQTYAHGQLRRATVTSVKQTPVAPMSKQIGFALEDPDDPRVYTCLWPNRAGKVAPGQAIDVIVPRKRTRSLAAAAYE